MLATTKSHRASADRDLVSHLACADELPFARIDAQVHRAAGDLKVEIVLRLEKATPPGGGGSAWGPDVGLVTRKRIKANGIARHALDYVGQVNAVMFDARDIDLVGGSPALGRRYLDLIGSQTDSRYLRCLQRYQKVVLQRNQLLRLLQEGRAQAQQLEFWDEELVKNGSFVVGWRRQLVSDLNALAQEVHRELSGGTERLDLVYQPAIDGEGVSGEIETRFRQALRWSARAERSQGVTMVGPHRDSLRFQVNGMDIGKYGSRGQQQTAALSLRLAEAKYVHSRVGDPPILLLDDVFSELDQSRRQHLLGSIAGFQQVLITTVDVGYFEPSFLTDAAQLRVKEGSVEPL